MAEPKRVLQEALELPPRERADLLEAIAASLDGFELSPEWEDEIRRRTEDLDAGRVQPVSGEEVFLRLEQRLRAR
jgi:putative addiction module component (TIGR02574 family)